MILNECVLHFFGCIIVEGFPNYPYQGAVMVMKNDDVYSIVNHSTSLTLLGVSELKDLLPFLPVKIDGLCGLQIRGRNYSNRIIFVCF